MKPIPAWYASALLFWSYGSDHLLQFFLQIVRNHNYPYHFHNHYIAEEPLQNVYKVHHILHMPDIHNSRYQLHHSLYRLIHLLHRYFFHCLLQMQQFHQTHPYFLHPYPKLFLLHKVLHLYCMMKNLPYIWSEFLKSYFYTFPDTIKNFLYHFPG